MHRMKRKDVLAAIRVAGYHDDKELGKLLYIKNWVSQHVYLREFEAGAAMRQNGIPCECMRCRNGPASGSWPPVSMHGETKKQETVPGLPFRSNLN